MKSILFSIILLIISCGSILPQRKTETKNLVLNSVGAKIQGDFDGDGKMEEAIAVLTKKGHGNPVEDGIPDEYEIQFSNKKIKSIKANCCEIRLVNEGDLNKDGTDEISIFQAPMNGCSYTMTTYSYKKGIWKPIVKTFLVPTACEKTTNENLQKMIFREKKNIYYLSKDPNDETGKKYIKKKVKLN